MTASLSTDDARPGLASGAPEIGRRERRKLEVRNRILAASVALFDEKGTEETRVQEICERADVAHKTFFNHFQSKRHLLRVVAQHALLRLLTDIEEVRKQPLSTRQRLRLFFEGVADNAEEAGPMHRELLTEMVHVAHESGSGNEQARKLHGAFAALVRAGREAGEIDDRHGVETLTEMLMGAFYALMFNWANLDGYPLRERASATADFLADAVERRGPTSS